MHAEVFLIARYFPCTVVSPSWVSHPRYFSWYLLQKKRPKKCHTTKPQLTKRNATKLQLTKSNTTKFQLTKRHRTKRHRDKALPETTCHLAENVTDKMSPRQ
jgi:hypothetical protein